jgi:HrpA-like RNA helicase
MDTEYIEDLKLEKDSDTLIVSSDKKSLPILKYKLHILYLVENNEIVLIIGETGCGKSTRKV